MGKRKPKADDEVAVAPIGRPRLYGDAGVFSAKVEEYFAGNERPSLSGLAYFLGFSDRSSFTTYEDYGPEFSHTVKRARLRIEVSRHEQLLDKANFTAGVIFDLKNNHGWKDQQDLNVTATLHVSKEQRDAAYSAGSRADA